MSDQENSDEIENQLTQGDIDRSNESHARLQRRNWYTKLIYHNLEWLGDQIIDSHDIHTRLDFAEAFSKFYKTLTTCEQLHKFGRLYHTKKLVDFVVALSIVQSLVDEPQDDVSRAQIQDRINNILKVAKPQWQSIHFYEWNTNHWKILKNDLNDLRDGLLRADAALTPLDYDDDDVVRGDYMQENADPDGERARSPLYSSLLKRVMQAIDANLLLSPIRASLESQIRDWDQAVGNSEDEDEGDEEDSPTPQVDPEVLKAFWASVDQAKDPDVTDALRSLAFDEKSKDPERSLHAIDTISKILKLNPFRLDGLVEKIIKLVQAWNDDVFFRPPLLQEALSDEGFGVTTRWSNITSVTRSPQQDDSDSATTFGFQSPERQAQENRSRKEKLSQQQDEDEEEEEPDNRDNNEEKEVAAQRHRPRRILRESIERPAKRARQLIRDLRDKRENLLSQFKDPLHDACETAAQAMHSSPVPTKKSPSFYSPSRRAPPPAASSSKKRKTTPTSTPSGNRKRKRGTLYDVKKSRTTLQFDDSDDDDNDGQVTRSPFRLSALRVRQQPHRQRRSSSEQSRTQKPRRSQMKKYSGRRLWTDDEKLAIKQGIRDYGVGKWAIIKEDYKVVLRHRTSGQIKDCYRTMKQKGEV